MANNCLLEQLKGSVQNDNLPIYGRLSLKLKSTAQVGCYIRFDKATKVSLINAQFGDSTTEKTILANTDDFIFWTRTNTSQDSFLVIHDKYALVKLEGGTSGALDAIDLDAIKYCDKLVSQIGWNSSKAVGDFAVFNNFLFNAVGIFGYNNGEVRYDVERMLEARFASAEKVGFTINYANSGSGPIGNGKGLYFGGYEIKFGDSTLVATISGGQVNVTATVWDNGVEKTITGTYDGSSWSYA